MINICYKNITYSLIVIVIIICSFIKNGDEFTKELALISIQMCGAVASAPLPPLSERISPPKLDARKPSVTLAAG